RPTRKRALERCLLGLGDVLLGLGDVFGVELWFGLGIVGGGCGRRLVGLVLAHVVHLGRGVGARGLGIAAVGPGLRFGFGGRLRFGRGLLLAFGVRLGFGVLLGSGVRLGFGVLLRFGVRLGFGLRIWLRFGLGFGLGRDRLGPWL